MGRMVLMGMGNIVLFYCLKYLPVSTAITMYNLGPLFIFFIEALYFKVPSFLCRKKSRELGWP